MESLDKIDENPSCDSIVLVMMDVNGLKEINDNIGHEAGDELLIGEAECIRQAFGHYAAYPAACRMQDQSEKDILPGRN